MKNVDPDVVFDALSEACRRKSFIHLDKFVARFGCTEEQLEYWSTENEERKHVLDMAKLRIRSNAIVLGLTDKLSTEEFLKLMNKHFPEESWRDI